MDDLANNDEIQRWLDNEGKGLAKLLASKGHRTSRCSEATCKQYSSLIFPREGELEIHGLSNDLEFLAFSSLVLRAWDGHGTLQKELGQFLATKKLALPVELVVRDMIAVREGVIVLRQARALQKCFQGKLQGSNEAFDVMHESEQVFKNWITKYSPRLGQKRKFALLRIFEDLGYPPEIHRDDLWKMFEAKHPELLEGVEDETNLKSRTFYDAGLDDLEASKGGRPKRF
jgi:hypothetical protein